MKHQFLSFIHTHSRTVSICALLLAGLLVYAGFQLEAQKRKQVKMQEEHSAVAHEYEERIAELEKHLRDVEKERDMLGEELVAAEEKNISFGGTIRDIASTIEELDKLSKTDKELLQKYSKVYFLNEHYVPASLAAVPKEYLYSPDRDVEVHTQILPFLEALMSSARDDGMDLQIISAYRSFGTQEELKNHYSVTYGEGTANQFSAEQGYSEHQLGTAVDFTTSDVGAHFSGFEHTPEYVWLQENAHIFGFTLSYPENNSYYQFEPWHWRFVGKELATHLFENEKYFYDLNQREIDQYLVSIFE